MSVIIHYKNLSTSEPALIKYESNCVFVFIATAFIHSVKGEWSL